MAGVAVGELLRDESRRQIPRSEAAVRHERAQEVEVVAHAADLVAVERGAHQCARMLAVAAVRDELGDHRVVVYRDLAALENARVHAHHALRVLGGHLGLDPVARLDPLGLGVRRDTCGLQLLELDRRAHLLLHGQLVRAQRAHRGQEAAQRVLSVDTRLDGPAPPLDLVLRQPQLVARRHVQHLLDEVEPRHGLRHGVLHLQPRVHLEEIVLLPRVDQELDRACGAVAHRLGQRHRLLAHRAHGGRGEARRRRLLDDLLVAPLDRAVTLGQVDRIAVRVGEQLDLDVPRPLDVTLDEDAVVAEGGGRLPRRELEALPRLRPVPRDTHALAATARRCLDHDGVAHLRRDLDGLVGVAQHAEEAGDGVDACLRRELLRLDLVAHRADRVAARSDEGHTLGLNGFGKGGVLREEAVAGMDGLRAGGADHRDDPIHPEVRVGRRRLADAYRLVGHRHVRCTGVRLRVDGNRLDAKPLRGAHDAARNLAAVGDEQRVEQPAHAGAAQELHPSDPHRTCAARKPSEQPTARLIFFA